LKAFIRYSRTRVDIAARMNGLASDLESGKQGDVPAAKLLGEAPA